MPPWTRVAINERVGEQEVLRLSWRFEAPHLPFPPARQSMRVLSAIVEVAALSVLNVRQHRAPEVLKLPLDPDEDLVQMPLVTGLRPTATQFVRKVGARLVAPAPDALVGHDHAPLGKKQLDVPQAQTKDVI